MGTEIFLSKSATQTQKFAAKIVKDLLAAKSGKNVVVLALEGELGGGKTTFVQGLAKALGAKEKITSPTFVIMRRFSVENAKLFPERSPAAAAGRSRRVSVANLYHIDCYRLNVPKELAELDFKKIIERPENLVVIEWADKIKSLIPKDAVWVEFEWEGENKRKITVKNF